MDTARMIAAHPHVDGHLNDALAGLITEALNCAQVCTSCADACAGEANVADLVDCIRLNADCADICMATARIATRRTGSNEDVIRAMLGACITACSRCGEMCEGHAEMMEHCRICAESCRRCEAACGAALETL